MAKDRVFRLPPSLDEIVLEDHPAQTVREIVEEMQDFSSVVDWHSEVCGQSPYNSRMMMALIFYSCCRGLQSFREVAQHCHERMGFMVVTTCQHLDFRTVDVFRKHRLSAHGGLFDQMPVLCRAMSYGWTTEAEESLTAQTKEMLERVEAVDTAEDLEHGVCGGSGMLLDHFATARSETPRTVRAS